jgi:hypothetical protein
VGGDPRAGLGSIVAPTFAHGVLQAAGGKTPDGYPGQVVAFDPGTGAVRSRHASRSSIATSSLELGPLLEELRGAVFPTRGIQVETEVASGLVVVADQRLLASTVGNLLQNALKFTRPGGRIRLMAKRSGSDVCVKVRDGCSCWSGHWNPTASESRARADGTVSLWATAKPRASPDRQVLRGTDSGMTRAPQTSRSDIASRPRVRFQP